MKVFVLVLGLLSPTFASAGALDVSASTYGEDWPFPEIEGVIRCYVVSSGLAVVLDTEAGQYALNGTALAQIDEFGLIDTRDIRERDADGMFANGVTTISELIQIGVDNC